MALYEQEKARRKRNDALVAVFLTGHLSTEQIYVEVTFLVSLSGWTVTDNGLNRSLNYRAQVSL